MGPFEVHRHFANSITSLENHHEPSYPLAALVAAAALVVTSGCAVTRGQESVGAYVDDASITHDGQGRMVEDKYVDASAIQVETLNGNVHAVGLRQELGSRRAPPRASP